MESFCLLTKKKRKDIYGSHTDEPIELTHCTHLHNDQRADGPWYNVVVAWSGAISRRRHSWFQLTGVGYFWPRRYHGRVRTAVDDI